MTPESNAVSKVLTVKWSIINRLVKIMERQRQMTNYSIQPDVEFFLKRAHFLTYNFCRAQHRQIF